MLGVIVETGCTPAAADALGISEPTFKSHLRRLLVKTGLKRQVDLAKLLARHASPFRQ
jgi:DNA-binding CsgD family transcriptional regulator